MTNAVTVRVEDLAIDYVAMADAGRFRRRRTVVAALSEVDFELYEGDAVGIIGHNGSGKSTLMQAVAGLLPPSSGSVLVSSQPQLLGVQAALNLGLSGHANIELCSLALGFSPQQIDELREDVAKFTDLGDFLDLPARSYSAGMRQRLGFAISVLARPQILLIDEALAVGDKDFKQKCLGKLRELRENAGTVLLASHAMGEITSTCNRALWIHEGRLVMDGDPNEVAAAYSESKGTTRRV